MSASTRAGRASGSRRASSARSSRGGPRFASRSTRRPGWRRGTSGWGSCATRTRCSVAAEQMRTPERVQTLHLFEPERAALLDVLGELSPREWGAATVCPGWTVKDIAAHLVGDDLGIVARWRDGETAASVADTSWEALVAAINERNEAWVDAMRRLSPRLLVELLGWVGKPVLATFQACDPDEPAGPVSWAGPESAPRWLHIAREFTERWHHQQQVREAVGAPSLDDPRFLGPVLATFARSLP